MIFKSITKSVHSELCVHVCLLWSVSMIKMTMSHWVSLTTSHSAHSLTFGLHPLVHPHKHTDTWLVRHSESAELVWSLLAQSLASFPRSGFTCLCALHIFKSSTSLWTSLGPAQKITAKAWSAGAGKVLQPMLEGRELDGPCWAHGKEGGSSRGVKATFH